MRDGDVDLAELVSIRQGNPGFVLLFEPPRGCDMIRVNVGIHRVTQLQTQFPQESDVPRELLVHWINEDGFTRLWTAQQVGVRG